MVSLALLYEVVRWEESAIIEEAKRLGLKVVPVHLHNISLALGEKWPELDVDVDIALQRAISHAVALNSAIVFESLGVRVVNSSYSLAVSMNKLWTLKLLAERGVPIPRTAVAFSEEGCFKAAEALGFPLVVKPIDGSWGRLIAMARDGEELRAIVEHRSYIPVPTMKVHMLQEFVRKPGRDIRVFVIGDEVPAAIYRVNERHWITNTARGGRAEPLRVTDELRELALRAAKAVGGEVLGVDIFEHPERGYIVNEINAVPEFKNTVVATGVPIHRLILDYLVSVAKR